jgi:nicotinamide-nucleotide amidase
MNAEIIAIGDELVSGQRLDTNSRWLSERLGELGVRALYHTTVGDDLAANIRVFREAIDRVDTVVCTGGLGPTADDLTREALAGTVGVDLVRDDAALEQIRLMFARRKRDMPQRNVVQAMFPRGSRAIPNPHGTAPGIHLKIPREDGHIAHIFALPGVPAEMRQMWDETVAPAILASQGEVRRTIHHRRIKCFGAGESHIEQMLPDLIRRGRHPTVGITASKATITLRVSAMGASSEECDELMAPTMETIRSCLGSLVFGEDDDELQHAVARVLSARKLTLATAEWGTCGLVAHWLSKLPSFQDFYRGGLVYSPHPSNLAGNTGNGPAESDTTNGPEEAMKGVAVSLRAQFDADLGLAVSDFPADSSAGDVPPNFVMALATPDGVEVGVAPFASHPDLLAQFSAMRALDFVRLAIPTIFGPAASGRANQSPESSISENG